uniref:60S ribosomal protein L6 n=1 Tax=Heterorhabditis bacteriophora TaxID=37862 RepID=A0A1I7WV21_HETBA
MTPAKVCFGAFVFISSGFKKPFESHYYEWLDTTRTTFRIGKVGYGLFRGNTTLYPLRVGVKNSQINLPSKCIGTYQGLVRLRLYRKKTKPPLNRVPYLSRRFGKKKEKEMETLSVLEWNRSCAANRNKINK